MKNLLRAIARQFERRIVRPIIEHALRSALVLALAHLYLCALAVALVAHGAALAGGLVGLAGLALLAAVLALVAAGQPAEQAQAWIAQAVAGSVRRERAPAPTANPPPVPEPVVIREPVEVPLEDNQPFAKLAKENADFMAELDALSPQIDEGSRKLVQHVTLRLQEALERCGVDRIEEDTVYDIVRHRSVSGQRIVQGETIQETVEPGLVLGRKVLRRAKVR